MTPIYASTIGETLFGIAFLIVIVLGLLSYLFEAELSEMAEKNELRARLAREAEHARSEQAALLATHRQRAHALQEKQRMAQANLLEFHVHAHAQRVRQHALSETVLAAQRSGEPIDRTREKLSRISR